MARQVIGIGAVANDGTGDTLRASMVKVNENFNETFLDNRIIVKQASDFGTIDSTKEYFLDGIIDMGATSIEIPAGGLFIAGYNFDTSGMTSTENSYTMFTSPVGGSGNVLFKDFHIDVSGTSSKVYDIASDTGAESIEVTRINYNNCTSLGEIDNYRQGLESGTGRFGGSPSMTLTGVWLGGFIIKTSLTRGMSDTTTEPLFKAGTGFVMNSRFKTDMNVDLGTLQPLLDFAPSNFPNASTLQLEKMEVTRDGVYDASDTNATPNVLPSDICSYWKDNNGLNNTYVGGVLSLTTAVETTINTVDVFETLAGTYTSSDLQHFDVPASGQLRMIGVTPRDFKIICYVVMTGGANDIITVRIRKYDSSATTTSTVVTQTGTINNFQGGTDRTTFTIIGRTTLDNNDYFFVEVANETDTTNITASLGSFLTIEAR